MTQTVTLTTNIWIDGVLQTSGSTISVNSGLAGELVSSKRATYVSDPMGGSRTEPVTATRDASGNVVGLSAGQEIDLSALALPGYTRTLSGTVIYADGNTLIDLGQPIAGATLTVSPQTGEAGIDYSADAVPHVSTGEWVAVYGGNVSANSQITFGGTITAIRIRPIASGADIDYTITAPGTDYFATGAITFAGGNVLVTLPEPMSNVSAFVLPSAGAIGVDYTADVAPNVTTGYWTEVYGGDIIENSSIEFTSRITGIRFRPIAAGAAADYQVRG